MPTFLPSQIRVCWILYGKMTLIPWTGLLLLLMLCLYYWKHYFCCPVNPNKSGSMYSPASYSPYSVDIDR